MTDPVRYVQEAYAMTTAQGTAATAAAAAETGAQEATATTTPPAPTGKPDELPEWARKAIKDANDEAAKSRVEKRDLEAKLANAKSLEEFQSVATELAEANKKNAELERNLLLTTLSEGLNAEMKAALAAFKGDGDALKAFAETLRKIAGTPGTGAPQNLGGGLTPGTNEQPYDAVAAAKNFRRR